MKIKDIKIEWEGPFNHQEVIGRFNRGGKLKDNYSGEDYGLYQIYGAHISFKEKILLYIGQAKDQTFSNRFYQHYKEWMYGEDGLEIYLGRIETDPNDKKFKRWGRNVDIAEAMLIYKYTPNYNSRLKQEEPKLYGFQIKLQNKGNKGVLEEWDIAPKDYQYKKIDLKSIMLFKKAFGKKGKE